MKRTRPTTTNTIERLNRYEYGEVTASVRSALFFLAARVGSETVDADTRRVLSVLGESEWHTLFLLCLKQEIAPLVYPLVQAAANELAVPEYVLQSWKKNAMHSLLYQERMKESLRVCMRTLNANGVKAVLTKGLRMSRLYPEPGLRYSVDIDLFALRRDRKRIAAMMAAAGYVTPGRFIPNPVHVEYHKPGQVTVEMHHRLMHAWYFPVPASFWYQSLVERAIPAEHNGERIWLTSPGDEFVFQIVHLIRHYLSGGAFLKLFLDVAMLLRQAMSPEDLRYAANTLKRLGFYPAACHFAAVSAFLFGFVVPEPFQLAENASRDMVERFLEDLFVLESCAGSNVKRWQHGLVHFYLFSRGRPSLKGLAYVLQTATDVVIYRHGLLDSIRFNRDVLKLYGKREAMYREIGLLAVKPFRSGICG